MEDPIVKLRVENSRDQAILLDTEDGSSNSDEPDKYIHRLKMDISTMNTWVDATKPKPTDRSPASFNDRISDEDEKEEDKNEFTGGKMMNS